MIYVKTSSGKKQVRMFQKHDNLYIEVVISHLIKNNGGFSISSK